MNNTNIFVSSTCYDLSQIRVDLSDFIVKSGHTPVLSESENFPIISHLTTVENCIKNVKDYADILILIVGNRYGSLVETGKSITNTEFITAKNKGIPIFCFVDKKTLNTLNFWRENKDANFEKFVDNTKIFEFISEIRDNSKIWTFEFETAQDIISVLKIQLSYLFKDSLKIKNKYENNIPDYFKLNLSDKAIKIIIDKSEFYEYEFLAQTMVDEIRKKETIKNDFKYNLTYEPLSAIYSQQDLPNWALSQLSGLENLMKSAATLINKALKDFLNEPGKSADLNGLYYISRKYAEIFEKAIQWKINTVSCYVERDFEFIKFSLGNMINMPIKQLWDYPFFIFEEFKKLEKISKAENLTLDLSLKLIFDPFDEEKFKQDLNKLNEIFPT